jgi:hypothetical protein
MPYAHAGALLVVFLKWLLQASTMSTMTSIGLVGLPSDVLAYAVTKIMPLLLPSLATPAVSLLTTQPACGVRCTQPSGAVQCACVLAVVL